MSTEPKKKRSRPRTSPESETSAGQTRKERYQADGDPEFSTGEKISYFIRKGGPWVAGGLVVIFLVSFAVSHFQASIRPDTLSDEDEAKVRQLISNAAKYDRQGDEFVAAAELEAVLKRYPTSRYRPYVEELLELHRAGKQMFTPADGEDGLARAEERIRRPSGAAVASQATGDGRVGRRRGGAPTSDAATETQSEPADQAPTFPPDPPVASSIDEALARESKLNLKAGLDVRPLPEGYLIQGDEVDESGWPAVIVCLADQSEMVLVPGGKTPIGDNAGQDNEKPAHVAELSPYYIDRTEINLAQYQAFLEKNPEHPKLDDAAVSGFSPEHPVTGVGYEDAVAYLAWAGKQLPTETQWEKAARGASSYLYPWGHHGETSGLGENKRQVSPVKSRPADFSPFGVFDMGGNAAEWCRDWYVATAYQAAASSGETRVLSLNRTERSIRGGGSDWKVTWRHGQPEGKSAPWLGFRGVLELDGKAEPKPEEDEPVAETKGRASRRGRRSGGGANAGGAPAAVSTPMPTPARGARGDRGRSNEGVAVESRTAVTGGDRSTRSARDAGASNPVVTEKPKAPERGDDRDRTSRNN